MSFDLFGQVLGKARRRELEGHVKINLFSIGKRLAIGAAAAAIAASAKPDLLGSKTGVLSLVGIGLTAMIPAGAASTGLVTSAQTGSPSVAESLVQGLVNGLSASADKRQAATTAAEMKLQTQIQTALHEGLSEYGPTLVAMAADKLLKTGQFGPGDLAAAPTPKTTAEAPTDAQTAMTDGQTAILATGGNQ